MNIDKLPSEHAEQVTFVNWFRLQFPKVLIFAIPNGGLRNAVVAKKLKLEGVIKGVPDLYIPSKKIWIEMKRQKGGKLSNDQKRVIKYLEDNGDRVIIGYGFKDAKEQILKLM